MKLEERKEEMINASVKLGKVVQTEEAKFLIEEYNKDGDLIDEIDVEELLYHFLDKEYCKIEIKYKKEL